MFLKTFPNVFLPDLDLSVFNPIFTLTSRGYVADNFWGFLVISKLFPVFLYILSQVPLTLLLSASECC